MKTPIIAVVACCAAFVLDAAVIKTVGNWKISFEEKESVLTLDDATRHVKIAGKLSFKSRGNEWKIVTARDAALDRLSLVNPNGTVLGYVSFRGEGDRVTAEVFHRAGANFFPGILSFDAKTKIREQSFACRTIPALGEQVMNFGDGAADTALNDSVFAREEDFAVRFFSGATRLKTLGGGNYSVRLEADVDNPARASFSVVADAAYFRSRWAPGYRPIDRKRCPHAPTGWMSWNTYFDKAGSAENLAEARVGAKYLKPFGMEIWSIESWQDNSLWLPVGHFHNLDLSCYKPQFPEGMKWLADEIRKLGFRPGLWMPLYGTGDQAFHDAHREWFLHDAAGKPIDCWNGRYMLDTTNPDALAHLRKICRVASREWGYEFFKFDGMANTPRKFERPEIRARMRNPKDAQWFDRSVRAMRDGIGEDRIMLGCMGDYTGTEAQYLDATRLGADVVGCYGGIGESYHPLGTSRNAQMPVTWQNVIHQAQCTYGQIFVNNLMHYTDPDTLLVGYVLEKHEAEVMATIVALPGQLMFAGDRLAALQNDRMKMIQQVLPVADIHPQNLYPFAAESMLPVWNLTVTRPFDTWHVVALFNYDDAPKTITVPMTSLGLDAEKQYAAWEFWSQKSAGLFAGAIETELPMRSVKVFAVREAANRPQFVGDDRHLTMGAVELNDLKWDERAKRYRVNVTAVGTFPLTVAVRIPEGFALKNVTAGIDGAEGSVKLDKRVDGDIVRATVTSEKTGRVTIDFAF